MADSTLKFLGGVAILGLSCGTQQCVRSTHEPEDGGNK